MSSIESRTANGSKRKEELYSSSNDKKYELLLDDTIVCDGKTLFRIRALKGFRDVIPLSLGGYIESEDNLSQDGGCWVYPDAIVMDSARVLGNAKVFEHAMVYDDAVVRDNAWIYGHAKIFEHAHIGDSVRVLGNAQISGDSHIYGEAWIFDCAVVSSPKPVSDY